MRDWNGKRVVILGAARQGVALARWLTKHGARVILNDKRPKTELASAFEALNGVPVKWVVGDHPLELLDQADILCISGGVPLSLPIVVAAAKRGLLISNDTQIFMGVVPCKTVGITGSAGKTTTTSLVGRMAKNAYGEKAFIGGNIGDPLLNYVDDMKPDDLAILEISSFQLEQMTISPNVASILNITPNHLDRHGTMEAYVKAKLRILEFQCEKDIAVVGRDDAGAWDLHRLVKGKLHSFGFSKMENDAEGTYFADGILYLYDHHVDIPLLRREQVDLRGDHNVMNVLAAFAIGHAAGLPLEPMVAAVEDFQGVPHRLELVREYHGVRWYNDSIATAPERVLAALHSFQEPVVLLLGGRDKNLPWEDLAAYVHERVDHVIIFGEAADKIVKAIDAQGPGKKPLSVTRVEHLQAAVQKSAEVAETGDVVLFSPGGTSFDEFKDFEERGEKFKTWVHELS